MTPPEMVTVRIDSDEWYPVYSADIADDTPTWERRATVPREQYERWVAAAEQFEDAQLEMEEAWKAAKR